MTVRFFGRNSGAFHCGRIVAMTDHAVTIDEPTLNLRHTNVPYAAIDLNAPHEPSSSTLRRHAPPPRPHAPRFQGRRSRHLQRS
jgi:hypothetical protein